MNPDDNFDLGQTCERLDALKAAPAHRGVSRSKPIVKRRVGEARHVGDALSANRVKAE